MTGVRDAGAAEVVAATAPRGTADPLSSRVLRADPAASATAGMAASVPAVAVTPPEVACSRAPCYSTSPNGE